MYRPETLAASVATVSVAALRKDGVRTACVTFGPEDLAYAVGFQTPFVQRPVLLPRVAAVDVLTDPIEFGVVRRGHSTGDSVSRTDGSDTCSGSFRREQTPSARTTDADWLPVECLLTDQFLGLVRERLALHRRIVVLVVCLELVTQIPALLRSPRSSPVSCLLRVVGFLRGAGCGLFACCLLLGCCLFRWHYRPPCQ